MFLPKVAVPAELPESLAAFKGKALLVVNVASKCGLTPQYTALEALQKKYASKGFTVVGFPCNQFLGQEPQAAAAERADVREAAAQVATLTRLRATVKTASPMPAPPPFVLPQARPRTARRFHI